MTAPPQYLTQEGSLISRGQWDLPVTQLLPQAAVQQAQHRVVGRTGPLGERNTLWLCPTHTLLSTQSLLLPSVPSSTLASKALWPQLPPVPSLICSSTHLLSNMPACWSLRRGVSRYQIHPPLESKRKNICSCWHCGSNPIRSKWKGISWTQVSPPWSSPGRREG